MEGLGLYFVPLMVGTRNAAFPRLNAFGYYAFLGGGLLLWGGLLLNAGADAGWFAYTPLSGPDYSPGHRVDIWADMPRRFFIQAESSPRRMWSTTIGALLRIFCRTSEIGR